MNGFLVMVVRNFSNTPVRLFATREEAEAFVKTCRATGEDDGPNLGRGCIATGIADRWLRRRLRRRAEVLPWAEEVREELAGAKS